MYFLTLIQEKFRLYGALARVEKPLGTLLLLWPCYWGLALHGSKTDFKWWFLFGLGAFLMRGAGCVFNDIADYRFDAQVSRTKNRPLAANLLTVTQALVFAIVLCLLAFVIFLLLPSRSQLWSLLGLALLIIYPFTKRFFVFPQFVLGLAFNIGIFVAWHVIEPNFYLPVSMLYLAAIFWTLAYDTIYALQDIKDDEKIGVYSTALYFKKNPKLFIGYCYGIFLSFMFSFGYLYQLSIFFWIVSIINILMCYHIVYSLVPDDVDNCLTQFKRNNLVGICVFVSIFLGVIF